MTTDRETRIVILVVVGERARYTDLAGALDADDLLLATGLDEARDRLEATDPEALLLAVDLDGEAASFLEDVRGGAYGRPGIPVVAVTEGDEELAASLGVDVNVEPPTTDASLRAAVERATLLGRYKTAVNEFFDACRRRAQGSAVSDPPRAARRHADEILAEIQSTDASIPFERLVERN